MVDIRNSIDGLKTLLGVPPTSSTQTQSVRSQAAPSSTTSDHDRATLSGAGAEVSQVTSGPDVRAEKVAAVRAALAAGTYQVPASAVAPKVVDTMLSGGSASEN